MKTSVIFIFLFQTLSYAQAGSKETGTISGKLGYPSDQIPPMKVCAVDIKTHQEFCQNTALNQPSFSLSVPVGKYKVYASLKKTQGIFDPEYKAYYSEYVKCGIKVGCTSHNPIEIEVKSKEKVDEVNPKDWYLKRPAKKKGIG